LSRKLPANVAASVRQRLLNKTRETGEDFQLLLTRYALERFLYRLGISQYRNKFVLKGAMLYLLWDKASHRPTRDLDLHGVGDSSVDHMEMVIKEICGLEVEDDGVAFLPETVRGEEIREDQEYAGVRLQLGARLAGARMSLQIDVGFGDDVYPEPQEADYPTVLAFQAPRIRVYPRESVVAEKYHALVFLGIANSRMKDYFDLWTLAKTFAFEGEMLARSIEATFIRRRTEVPSAIPMGLSDEFCDDAGKQAQWRAFLTKGRLVEGEVSLREVAEFLRIFLMPPSTAIVGNKRFGFRWPAAGPWA